VVHLLGDGEGLVDEAVGQTFHVTLFYGEAEVVLAVFAQRQRAVVLAEEWVCRPSRCSKKTKPSIYRRWSTPASGMISVSSADA